jgi:hypothetical protein
MPMPTDAKQNAAFLEALARKHESRNPPIKFILLAACSVVLMVVACEAISWSIMNEFKKERPLDTTVEARGIVIAPNLDMLKRFPAPNLQINPHDDLMALRAREDAELNTYGWVDRSNGVVRIPIARAMDLIVAQGLPTRSTNAPATTGKSSVELIRERSAQP